MIEGRILMSEARLHDLVLDMIARADRDRALWHMVAEIKYHCETWHLPDSDAKLLRAEIVHRYEIYEKFFDKPNQTGT